MPLDKSDWSVGYNHKPSQEQIDKWEAIKSVVSEVYPHLYITGYPDDSVIQRMKELKIEFLISTTVTPPPSLLYLWVYRVPFMDNKDELPDEKCLADAVHTGTLALYSGRNVLIHCAYGLNRSSLIAAKIIHNLSGMAGPDIVSLIRDKRPGALHNPLYAANVAGLKGFDNS
jgi:hypothetical protein